MSNGRRRLRIVVDTNVIISSLFSQVTAPYTVVMACLREEVVLVMSPEQRLELHEVLHRPQIVEYSGASEQHLRAVESIAAYAETVAGTVTDIMVRDLKDQPILSSAILSHADYLVTGDQDLLVLASDPRIAPLRIVMPREFVDILEADK